jgi:hypothetical protein
MATATIASEIQGITGVTTADANFIVSAQKFVVANVPKNLLKWASSFTDPSTDGGNSSGNIVVPIGTDGILSVSRNGFSAQEVSREDSAFMESNSGSLKIPTSTFPKYYFDNAASNKGSVIIVKPSPTDSETAKALYIDHTKIDDDSDLRNVVINYACFKEFAKLMMADALQGDYTDSTAATGGTQNWIVDEEDSEMLTARVQTIQAQIAEKTHYGQMSQQHYNLALAEIKSYIENHPKTLATAMAMQGAR